MGDLRPLYSPREDPRNKGVLSLGQILAQSSQVGITKVALQLPDRALPSVLQRVGLTELSGSGLPGETMGVPMSPLLKAAITLQNLPD